MCGRFALGADPKALIEQFSLPALSLRGLAPRYNIAPTQPVVAVRARNAQGEREAVLLQWGLVPGWAKDPALGSRMINARAETVAEKPSFRNAFKHRRCLVPASGFYEWARTAGGKQPYHIRRRDGGPFALAGLWEHWMGGDGSELSTCAILTTAANAQMAALHHRMPVVLEGEHYQRWLDPAEGTLKTLGDLLEGREWPWMEALAVSTYVNNPRNEGAQCVAPQETPSPGESA